MAMLGIVSQAPCTLVGIRKMPDDPQDNKIDEWRREHTMTRDRNLSKVRPALFGIAYRILGSAAEAEDIVQDVWLRWQASNRSVILDPPASN